MRETITTKMSLLYSNEYKYSSNDRKQLTYYYYWKNLFYFVVVRLFREWILEIIKCVMYYDYDYGSVCE